MEALPELTEIDLRKFGLPLGAREKLVKGPPLCRPTEVDRGVLWAEKEGA